MCLSSVHRSVFHSVHIHSSMSSLSCCQQLLRLQVDRSFPVCYTLHSRRLCLQKHQFSPQDHQNHHHWPILQVKLKEYKKLSLKVLKRNEWKKNFILQLFVEVTNINILINYVKFKNAARVQMGYQPNGGSGS